MESSEIEEWRRIVIDVMREFHELCRANGLRYFACGGTAIGAVRHKGIIPWDDDIDVSMPRPDYDRLIALCKERELGDYELLTPQTTEDYPLPFVKFCNRHTTLIEQKHIPCVMGVFIDIFPLDGTSSDVAEAVKMKRRYEKLWNKLEAVSSHTSFAEHLSLLANPREWGRFMVKTIGYFWRDGMRKVLLKKIDAISRANPFETSENLIVYGGSYGEKEVMPSSFCAGEDIAMPFENITIMMPSSYDTYLSKIYGNYMQWPPKDKQVSHHHHALIDLTKRLSRKQALSQLAKQ